MITFRKFFEAVWGKSAFPWQEELANRVIAGKWPGSIGLPTAAGKTALIDIAVWALAMGSPAAARRIFFVVDRRVIVDEAAERAQQLAEILCNADPSGPLGEPAASLRQIAHSDIPLCVAVLRGALPREDWTDSPLQPTVICSTVDQIGSSLLFRGYGTSEYSWPIRAGLAAYDSLIILDEAHTSQPFAETLESIRGYRDWADQPLCCPMTIVEMSATPRAEGVFCETEADLNHPILKKRWEAEKRAKLVTVDPREGEEAAKGGLSALQEALVREARKMRDEHHANVIGVVVNRVATARMVHTELIKENESSDAILLIGRARPYDREGIWRVWKDKIGLQRTADPERPVFVVATQCIEVGANISFDALVTELASLDALEQRFGRLDRDGKKGLTHAAIVAQKDQTRSKYHDPVYGDAMAATWDWLQKRVTKNERTVTVPTQGKRKPKQKKVRDDYVSMGVLSLRHSLASTCNRESLVMPRASAPVLLPAHMDLLCQTSPEPAISPEPALFLHGPQTGPADVQVIWRMDLEESSKMLWPNIVSICPPSAAEALSVPIWAVRAWLSDRASVDVTDVEGTAGQGYSDADNSKSVLCWKGLDESEVVTADKIRPGMTIIVPSRYGGCDEWGWAPTYRNVVKDVGDAVRSIIGRPILRLSPALAESQGYAGLARSLSEATDETEALQHLRHADRSVFPEWLKEAIEKLVTGRLKFVYGPVETDELPYAVTTYAVFYQDSNRSSFTRETFLTDHAEGAARWAAAFAGDLPERVARTVTEATRLHDIGKADPRFQAWLNGGNPRIGDPIAKSNRAGHNGRAIERARVLARYPKGARHELLSVALADHGNAEFSDVDCELLLHLIGSHHGRCRPFAPVVQDADPCDVSYNGWTSSTNHKLERAGSGVSERFWALIGRYGWYGLAYLESLVRLADHRRSEEETRESN